MDNKYEHSVIYKIKCKDENIKGVYIGSTTNFKQRVNSHKCRTTNIKDRDYESNLYKYLRKYGGWDNWEINIIYNIDHCDNKDDLLKLEKYYMENENELINKNKIK